MVTISWFVVLLPRKPITSHSLLLRTVGLTLFLFCCPQLLLLPTALADCECGYLSTIGNTTDPQQDALFTDLLESDFTHPHTVDLSQDKDWARQAFNLTSKRARGDYGEMFAVENVEYQPGGGGAHQDGKRPTTEGLKLLVRDQLVDGMVPVAEIDTRRLDIFYGTFRASMKVSSVPGTCAAFFWYFNDTQEIDLEFLTKDFSPSNSTFPVNLVLQSRQAAEAGYDASQTGTFVQTNLPFNPTDSFHEYRIDYLASRVLFYADGALLATMTGPAVPSSPGHLILQHWSNGNKYWSGGPPREESALVVRYVKAYFNSSAEQRQRDWRGRCRDPRAARAVCRIPDVRPGDDSAAGWFFGSQRNMTNNQTGSEQDQGEQSEGVTLGRRERWSTVGWLVVVGGCVVGLL
ncbi:hypothetical protein VTI74DRAFT_3289 [Chaetomium olivicolor]